MEAKHREKRASRVSQGKSNPDVPQVQARVPAAQLSHGASKSEATCRDRDQKAVVTLSCSISLPTRPFLPFACFTKGNTIKQAIFLPICGKLKPYASPLHHPTAGGQRQQYHHSPHDTWYLSFTTKGCMQECMWPSQTHSDPRGTHLLLSLTLENNCI